MKSAIVILFCVFLAGCGQSGKLYLPAVPSKTYNANDTEGRLSS